MGAGDDQVRHGGHDLPVRGRQGACCLGIRSSLPQRARGPPGHCSHSGVPPLGNFAASEARVPPDSLTCRRRDGGLQVTASSNFVTLVTASWGTPGHCAHSGMPAMPGLRVVPACVPDDEVLFAEAKALHAVRLSASSQQFRGQGQPSSPPEPRICDSQMQVHTVQYSQQPRSPHVCARSLQCTATEMGTAGHHLLFWQQLSTRPSWIPRGLLGIQAVSHAGSCRRSCLGRWASQGWRWSLWPCWQQCALPNARTPCLCPSTPC